MEKLLEILEDAQPNADYATCTTLIDDGIIDSFTLLSLINDLEDAYGIRITPGEIRPSNFNSAQAIYEMIQRLQA